VLQRALVTLMVRMLRPMARVALRHGMSCLEFEDITRWVFVDAALHDPVLSLPGRGKQFKSRAAILTGLSRKEVMRLCRQPLPGDHEDIACRNRAARVVAGWYTPPFADARGTPRVLQIKGSAESFVRLVREHGGDVPYRAILDELLQSGMAEKINGRAVRLKFRGKIYPRACAESLQKTGDGLDGLLAQVERHLHAEDKNGRRR
jgi:hypothetical protein